MKPTVKDSKCAMGSVSCAEAIPSRGYRGQITFYLLRRRFPVVEVGLRDELR